MKTGLQKNNEGWYYVSKSRIEYELLIGDTIGGDRRYTSDTLFIMLTFVTDTMEFADKFGNSRFLVEWFQNDGPDETDGLNEDAIREAVDKFEESHREMINYIKEEIYIRELAKRLKRIAEGDVEYEEIKPPLEGYIDDIKHNPTSVIEYLIDDVEMACGFLNG